VTCDPQVRDWLETGDTSVDPNVRKNAYKKALVRIAEQAYPVPMYSLQVYYAFTPDFDFTPYPDEMPRFWEAK
jgi:peptide/nickel transport system substrate-binding protein